MPFPPTGWYSSPVMGSSKSTLFGAILRHIIEHGGRNVITYEAPINLITTIPNAGGLFLKCHPRSFAIVLKIHTQLHPCRPDVVLIE